MWRERKAHLTDGTRHGLVLARPRTLRRVVAERRRTDPGRRLRVGRGPEVDSREALDIWSLRQYAGLQLRDAGERMGLSVSTVHRRVQECKRAMGQDANFREEAAAVLAEALARDFGGLPQGRRAPLLVPADERFPAPPAAAHQPV